MPITNLTTGEGLELWRIATVTSVRNDQADLSARQLGLLLTVYLKPQPHTVRGLAKELNISKPAITRALDKLQDLGYVKRKPDPDDKRSIIVQRTVKGSVFLTDFGQIITKAADAMTSSGVALDGEEKLSA